nr:SDR family oxidoreductase [uncultured Bdellovibrio sp.]
MASSAKKILTAFGVGFSSAIVASKIRDEFRARTFKGAVVVISGGSRGLGLVLAEKFAKAGASLALLARDEAELRRAQNIIQHRYPETLVHCFVCDCTKTDDINYTVSDILDEFGKIDVLVNNAGIISSAPIQNATEEDFEDSLEIHFWAPYHLIEACRPYLKAGSRIINIASIGGLVPVPHRAAYCAGKHALVGYSRTLRAELLRDKIYVTTVSPSVMRTGSIDHATFKGQVEKEYAWFSLLASLPGLSTNAEKAAQKIVDASKYGKAELMISASTKIATVLQARFPNFFSDIVHLANVVMPGPTDDSDLVVEGKDAHSAISPSVLTALSEKAALRNNEGSIRGEDH